MVKVGKTNRNHYERHGLFSRVSLLRGWSVRWLPIQRVHCPIPLPRINLPFSSCCFILDVFFKLPNPLPRINLPFSCCYILDVLTWNPFNPFPFQIARSPLPRIYLPFSCCYVLDFNSFLGVFASTSFYIQSKCPNLRLKDKFDFNQKL